MQTYWETFSHEVDFYAGLLVIAETETEQNFTVQLKDMNGRNITRKHFSDAAKRHGIDKACNTFKKLAGRVQ